MRPAAFSPRHRKKMSWDNTPAPAGDFASAPAADEAWGSGAANATEHNGSDHGPDSTKCFSCGEMGHRAADCPTPREMTCRFCHQPGHMVKDCPDKPPMKCENCGQDGHMKYNCENARLINRDHVATISPEEAWAKIRNAVSDRDIDDVKDAVQEYVKALDGSVTYRDLQEGFINEGINLFIIPMERPLAPVFTNMDLQGNMGKKYTVSYRFSEKPNRPREAEAFPKSREELLARLDDAGEAVNSGRSLCHNCGELGHTFKHCTQDRVDKPDAPKIACSNCGEEGHRIRDCQQPRVDKFACRNCGYVKLVPFIACAALTRDDSKSGHKASDCEEPPNLDNVECRKCGERGHFSRDCPQAGPRGCHNCGQEGHISKDCDQPRNMDNVTCRNCEKTGHVSRDCPEPKDWSKVQCSNCQQYGHTKVRCQQAPADSDAFASQGYDAGTNVASGPVDDGWGPTATATSKTGASQDAGW
ncbi:hypothetical protein CP533_2498 [Ophiocordyceps camponoti-saundersi (nom. inval.)]|nr:hypothetical protein CP533_2498 [Ophiocordyceps camponoti-saundersi (nom. inval.)]